MAGAPIRIENLDHHYGRGNLRKQILFGIDVEIPQGEIVIVTGPSGSGKTTLLTLVGALRSTQSVASGMQKTQSLLPSRSRK